MALDKRETTSHYDRGVRGARPHVVVKRLLHTASHLSDGYRPLSTTNSEREKNGVQKLEYLSKATAKIRKMLEEIRTFWLLGVPL